MHPKRGLITKQVSSKSSCVVSGSRHTLSFVANLCPAADHSLAEWLCTKAHADLVWRAGNGQKNGARFKAVVAQREAGNPRFAFLQPGSPHHWYYRYAPLGRVHGSLTLTLRFAPLGTL